MRAPNRRRPLSVELNGEGVVSIVRKVGWVAAVVVGLLVAWAVLHVFISPVHPTQDSPDKHVEWPCWTCHLVSGSAELVEVE